MSELNFQWQKFKMENSAKDFLEKYYFWWFSWWYSTKCIGKVIRWKVRNYSKENR